MEDKTSVGIFLEMRPSGRNEAPILVIMDKDSNSCLFDDGDNIEKHTEQVEDNQIAI